MKIKLQMVCNNKTKETNWVNLPLLHIPWGGPIIPAYAMPMERAISEIEKQEFNKAISSIDNALDHLNYYGDGYNYGMWKKLMPIKKYFCEDVLNYFNILAYCYQLKGYSLAKIKKYKESLDCLTKSITINPRVDTEFLKGAPLKKFLKSSTSIFTAEILFKLKKYKESLRCLYQYDRLSPFGVKGHNDRFWDNDIKPVKTIHTSLGCSYDGYKLYEKGKYSEAIPYFEKSIKLNPLLVRSYVFKTMILYKINDKNWKEYLKQLLIKFGNGVLVEIPTN